jgi:phosphomevalonate kinase
LLIRTSAPLSIFIAGEWADLEPKGGGITAAIDCRLVCEIEPNPVDEIEISLLNFNIFNVKTKYENEELIFLKPLSQEALDHLSIIKFTIETALFLLGKYKFFKIRIWCEKPAFFLAQLKTKFGIGRSAAVIVVVHAAIREFHKISIQDIEDERVQLLKASLLTYFIVQNMKGSGIDVVASIYGGIIHYETFDHAWLLEKIENNFPLRTLTEYTWPDLVSEQLPDVQDFQLLLGLTHKPVSIFSLISKMQQFKNSQPAIYDEIMSAISKLVNDLTKAWKRGKKDRILSGIRMNEIYLKRLGDISGIPLEIPELKLLCHIANESSGAGKLSGAGGGDCGIAICFDEKISNKILNGWQKSNILGLKVDVDFTGLKIEKITNKL